MKEVVSVASELNRLFQDIMYPNIVDLLDLVLSSSFFS